MGDFQYDTGNTNPVLCYNLEGGIRWEVGGRFKREGTYVYLWLIHVDVWQEKQNKTKQNQTVVK